MRGRQVVIEFKDYATALACYESEEYQRASALRARLSEATSSSSKATTDRSRPERGSRGAQWPICG